MNREFHNDWRLTNQKNYLYNKTLRRKLYDQTIETWDHDHCVFCWTRIDAKSPSAYTDEEGHWICEECYEEFKEMFEWEGIG